MRNTRRRAGFTLIELLIVVGILAVLGTVAVVGYQGVQEAANRKLAKASADSASKGMEMYFLAMKKYPSDDEGFGALINEPDDTEEAEMWKEGGGPWLEEEPKDPWGTKLKYINRETAGETAGKKFIVYSFGPNKTDDNGTEDDIPKWGESN